MKNAKKKPKRNKEKYVAENNRFKDQIEIESSHKNIEREMENLVNLNCLFDDDSKKYKESFNQLSTEIMVNF